jgi:hypothetical protein
MISLGELTRMVLSNAGSADKKKQGQNTSFTWKQLHKEVMETIRPSDRMYHEHQKFVQQISAVHGAIQWKLLYFIRILVTRLKERWRKTLHQKNQTMAAPPNAIWIKPLYSGNTVNVIMENTKCQQNSVLIY